MPELVANPQGSRGEVLGFTMTTRFWVSLDDNGRRQRRDSSDMVRICIAHPLGFSLKFSHLNF